MSSSNQNQTDSLISGLILVVVKEMGPEIVANISPIDDDLAFITAAHLFSLAGLMDTQEDEDREVIGPIPVKNTKGIKALFFLTSVSHPESKDQRLAVHGAQLGTILLFDENRLPEIRRAVGLIEPYLKSFFNKPKVNLDVNGLTEEFGKKLYDHIIELVSKPRTRAFWYQPPNKLIEYKDPFYIDKSKDIVIVDEYEKQAYILTSPNTSPFEARKLNNTVNQMNFDLYRGALGIQKMEDFMEIEPLLIKYGIKTY
ncbi:MAG: hypothetical protein D6732_01815 [Methanobacteriota archaeon]|nr:MAG: hypothetical protein D6732_01815 [Euryarchaeota archaeon]